jgi:beta-glucanase (GH16 family)
MSYPPVEPTPPMAPPGSNQPYYGRGSDPYGGRGPDPYAGQGSDPYGGQGSDPYGGRGPDPYAGQGSDPYGGRGPDPYQGQSRDPYAGRGSDDWPPPGQRRGKRRRASNARKFGWLAVIVVVVVVAVVAGVLVVTHRTATSASGAKTKTKAQAANPSGVPMPTGNLPGWTLTYSTDFSGTSLPAGWGAYSGQPGGDPYGYWKPGNVVVSGNELHLRTTPNDDPQRANTYSTGGVAFYGKTQKYGMYLVRMKGDSEPGLRMSNIALLWPEDNQSWPPEIDFYEDHGGKRSYFASTLHPGPNGNDCCTVVRNAKNNNGTQWHTYGVMWTPTSITYTIDGKAFGTVHPGDVTSPGKWPSIPMTLDLQSQNLGPTQPSHSIETMTVAWVAQYTPSS